MATLSSIITPTNITTASNTQTLTNKTITGGIYNGTVGATTPSTGAFTTLKTSGATIINAASSISGSTFETNGDISVALQGSGQMGLNIQRNAGTTVSWYNYCPSGSTDLRWYNSGDKMTLTSGGALTITGALSKGSGSFRIEHPLPSKSATHQLVHSFIEGPKCDLIYRGKVDLVDGKASVNIDADSTMTEGTFEALCATVQCFTSNESGWGAIRGKVIGNILTIEAQDSASTDNVSWMVIGERKDPHIMDTDWTDENGRPIVEPLKPAEPALESK